MNRCTRPVTSVRPSIRLAGLVLAVLLPACSHPPTLPALSVMPPPGPTPQGVMWCRTFTLGVAKAALIRDNGVPHDEALAHMLAPNQAIPEQVIAPIDAMLHFAYGLPDLTPSTIAVLGNSTCTLGIAGALDEPALTRLIGSARACQASHRNDDQKLVACIATTTLQVMDAQRDHRSSGGRQGNRL